MCLTRLLVFSWIVLLIFTIRLIALGFQSGENECCGVQTRQCACVYARMQPAQNHCPGMRTRSHEWDWVYFAWTSCFPLLTVSLNQCLTVLLYGNSYTLPPVPNLPLCPSIIKNTISYMFSRSTRKSADILLERKCAAKLENNRSVYLCLCVEPQY